MPAESHERTRSAKKIEFLGPGGGQPSLRARAVHRRPVAEQGVHLAVQAGHRLGAEQRHRPGQDLLRWSGSSGTAAGSGPAR